MIIYTKEKPPKRGNAKKAWDKYVAKRGVEPKEMHYSPSYNHDSKGWICEWGVSDITAKFAAYNHAGQHDFYPSNDL